MSQKIHFQLVLRKIWKTHDDNSTFLSESLKGWGSRCWDPNPSLLREKLGVVSLILTVLLYRGWRLWQECLGLSYPFWCGPFLVYLLSRSHGASFWISFSVVLDLVCMGRGEFRTFLYCCLLKELSSSPEMVNSALSRTPAQFILVPTWTTYVFILRPWPL